MRVIKSVPMSIAASLLLSAVAYADNSHASAPSLPWNAPTVQQVLPASTYERARPDWTAKIGTGVAASQENVVESDPSVSDVSAVSPHYPELPWSSTFGIGTAAAFER
jgi:hypothetical protein